MKLKKSVMSLLQRTTQLVKPYLHILIPALLVSLFLSVSISGMLYKSRTRDEARHLVRGVMLLETGDFRLNKHHPILANVLNAVPTLFIEDFRIPSTQTVEWKNADKDALSGMLVEANGGSRDFVPSHLLPARYMTIIAIAISAVIFYFVIKEHWGLPTASIFSMLYLFSPNIIAHAQQVTTDAWIVPLIFGATLALYFYAKQPRLATLSVFIILSFLSLLTKYSAIPVAFLWLVILFIIELSMLGKHPTSLIVRGLKASLLPLMVVALWFIFLTEAYGFRFRPLSQTSGENTAFIQSQTDSVANVAGDNETIRNFLIKAYTTVPLPFPEYIQGFYENVILHDKYGHDSFMYGMYSKNGWWYYFPLTILIKEPVTTIVGTAGLLSLGLAGVVTMAKHNLTVKQKRSKQKSFVIKPEHILLAVPLFFLLVSMQSSINLGMRHILPLLPFIYLGVAVLAVSISHRGILQKAIVTGFVGWFILSSLSVHPHYLEYFNEFVGGPENGHYYLLDSNLSWAQNMFYAKDYRGTLPPTEKVYYNPLYEVTDGYVIMDVDLLMGRDSAKREKTAWLREPYLSGKIEPIDMIAYTHLVFNIQPE
ncbi:MAG: glycosyltransferase family 39 protein [Candidatus Dojkabacteria bacterium]|nr:glycosyltransferase family 39 protein [Candidatus Dojkabacteria bacterium]